MTTSLNLPTLPNVVAPTVKTIFNPIGANPLLQGLPTEISNLIQGTAINLGNRVSGINVTTGEAVI